MLYASFYNYIRCEMNASSHTVSAYKGDIEQFRDFIRRSVRPDDNPALVTLADIRLWAASLSADGRSAASIKRKIQALRALYHYLGRRQGFTSNPAAEFRTPRLDGVLPDFVREEEICSILDSPLDDADSFIEFRDRLIINMIYATGMRAAELIGLKNSSVDAGRAELKVLGKRNKERIIPYGEELGHMISHYIRLRDRTVGVLSPGDTFFVRPDGQPLYYMLVYRIVRGTLSQAGVRSPKRSPHVLRHSFATDMLNNGADLPAVSELLGHTSLATTQRYTHLTYKELQKNYKLAHPRALKKED